jgi:hypothetical protein
MGDLTRTLDGGPGSPPQVGPGLSFHPVGFSNDPVIPPLN